ncbi:hypothetical protein BH10BAC2_BH10BAC2_07530 [soil metagenome]
MRNIKIFLASSGELMDFRNAFDLFMRRKNDYLEAQQIYLQIIVWENVDSAVSLLERKQDDYNQQIADCDILVSVFFTKAGKYTQEEFQLAYDLCKGGGKPFKIYTYFLKPDHTEPSLEIFRKYLNEVIRHFEDKVDSEYQLLFHFSEQLNRYLASVTSAAIDNDDTQYLAEQEKGKKEQKDLAYNNEATYTDDFYEQNNFNVTCSIKSIAAAWKLSKLQKGRKAQLKKQDEINRSGNEETYDRIYENLAFIEKADLICECMRYEETIDPCFDITISNYGNVPFHLLSMGIEIMAGTQRIISGGDFDSVKIQIQDHYFIEFPAPVYFSVDIDDTHKDVIFSLTDNPGVVYNGSRKGDSRSIFCESAIIAVDGSSHEIDGCLNEFDFANMPVTALSDITDPVLIPPFSPYRFTIKIVNSEHITTDCLLRFVFIGGGKQVAKTETIYFFKT